MTAGAYRPLSQGWPEVTPERRDRLYVALDLLMDGLRHRAGG
ncbi:hypothetical protein [Micromonospora avicenniae]